MGFVSGPAPVRDHAAENLALAIVGLTLTGCVGFVCVLVYALARVLA